MLITVLGIYSLFMLLMLYIFLTIDLNNNLNNIWLMYFLLPVALYVVINLFN